MKEIPIEVLFNEINQALENGLAKANEVITNSTTVLDFREILLHTNEMCAGYIGKAICEVFKKYTEEGK